MTLTNFNKKEVRVKSFVRKGKVVKSYKKKIDKRDNKLLKSLVIGGAATLGLTAVTYGVLRGRYRKGLETSADWVRKNVDNIKVPDISEANLKRNNINFAVGGLGYEDGLKKSTNLASYVEKKFKGYTVAIDTTSFNKLPNKAPKNQAKVFYDINRTKTVNALFNGYNPTARELAATMYAYHKKYPTHTMVSFGHSYGGAITDEAMNILKTMKVDMSKFKNVSYGATYNGILDTAPNSLNIIDVNDWQTKLKKFPNSTTIGKPRVKKGKTFTEKLMEDHGSYHYLSNQEAIDKTKQFIEPPKDWKPPIQQKTQSTVKKQISKQSSDNVTEEVRLLRDARNKLRQQRQSLNKTENNTSIPEDKKQKVLEGARKKVKDAENEYKSKYEKFKEKISILRGKREST